MRSCSWEGQGYLRSHGAVCMSRKKQESRVKSQESEIHATINPLGIHEAESTRTPGDVVLSALEAGIQDKVEAPSCDPAEKQAEKVEKVAADGQEDSVPRSTAEPPSKPHAAAGGTTRRTTPPSKEKARTLADLSKRTTPFFDKNSLCTPTDVVDEPQSGLPISPPRAAARRSKDPAPSPQSEEFLTPTLAASAGARAPDSVLPRAQSSDPALSVSSAGAAPPDSAGSSEHALDGGPPWQTQTPKSKKKCKKKASAKKGAGSGSTAGAAAAGSGSTGGKAALAQKGSTSSLKSGESTNSISIDDHEVAKPKLLTFDSSTSRPCTPEEDVVPLEKAASCPVVTQRDVLTGGSSSSSSSRPTSTTAAASKSRFTIVTADVGSSVEIQPKSCRNGPTTTNGNNNNGGAAPPAGTKKKKGKGVVKLQLVPNNVELGREGGGGNKRKTPKGATGGKIGGFVGAGGAGGARASFIDGAEVGPQQQTHFEDESTSPLKRITPTSRDAVRKVHHQAGTSMAHLLDEEDHT